MGFRAIAARPLQHDLVVQHERLRAVRIRDLKEEMLRAVAEVVRERPRDDDGAGRVDRLVMGRREADVLAEPDQVGACLADEPLEVTAGVPSSRSSTISRTGSSTSIRSRPRSLPMDSDTPPTARRQRKRSGARPRTIETAFFRFSRCFQ
jgi:hypothetical protein